MKNISNNKDKIIAKLVTKIDQLETELCYLNRMLKDAGFIDGITTLKETIEEIKEQDELFFSKKNQSI